MDRPNNHCALQQAKAQWPLSTTNAQQAEKKERKKARAGPKIIVHSNGPKPNCH